MVQPKYSPQEAMDRIKLMMKYDSSKTLTENVNEISDKNKITEAFEGPGYYLNGILQAAGKSGQAVAKGGHWAMDAAKYSSLFPEAEVAVGGIGAAGEAVGAALAASAPWILPGIAAAGLGYWLYDSISNGMPTASKVESFFNSCSTQSKNLKQTVSDSIIISAAEKINKAIEGLGTDEPAIKSAIESMPTVADLCALKTKYDARYGSLYEDIDGDIDGTDWKTYIWAPMQTIIEKAVQEVKPTKTGTTTTSEYKVCTGTYTQGCQSPVVAKVQGCLGLVSDGKFGPKTAAKLKEKSITSFVDADVDKICATQEEPKLTDSVEIEDLTQNDGNQQNVDKLKNNNTQDGIE